MGREVFTQDVDEHRGGFWPYFSYRDEFSATKDWKALLLWVALTLVAIGSGLFWVRG